MIPGPLLGIAIRRGANPVVNVERQAKQIALLRVRHGLERGFPAEQARILQLFLVRARLDGLELTLREGIDSLVEDLRRREDEERQAA